MRLIYFKNDSIIELLDLTDAQTDLPVNTATVTCDILTRGSTAAIVSGIGMTNVSTDGDYRGLIPSTSPIKRQGEYTARISAQGGGLAGFWEVPLLSRVRTT